jgi:pyruvate carboxylase subunit B
MRTFQARIGSHRFNLEYEHGVLWLNGEEVSFRFERIGPHSFLLLLDNRSLSLVIEEWPDGSIQVTHSDGRTTAVQVKDETALLLEKFGMQPAGSKAEQEIRAPMPGLVLQVEVEPGQHVEAGDGLVILEAMKMENELRAPVAATIKKIHVSPGDTVGKNAVLIELGV